MGPENYFNPPEGTLLFYLIVQHIDSPVVVYIQNLEQNAIVKEEEKLFDKNKEMSACNFILRLAVHGIYSVMFPASYKEMLIELFTEQ